MYTWFIAIPITLLLLWLAWRRPNRQRLALRVVASVVVGISLVLLVFPPTIQQAINPSAAILLTEGYNPDTLETLLQKLEAKPRAYTLGTEADKSTAIKSLHTLRQLQPGLQTVHLLGYGLNEAHLNELQGIQVVPHLSTAPSGISAVQWPEQVNLGEPVTIGAKYTNAQKSSTWLFLQAAGQLQDSVEVKSDEAKAVTLHYTPKTTGKYVYTLLANTDTLGQVPVQVVPAQQIKVLLLSSAPSFEFKFLKNHLAEQQHQVAFRASVSKDISQKEWLNMAKTDLSRITPKLLQQFDVVITEPQALQSMSTGERAALQRAVTESGLGVLTVATEPANSRSTSFFTGFQSKRLSQQDTRSTRASWTNSETPANAAPYTLTNTTAVTGLVTEQGNNLLAGAKKAGWGKVAMSYLPQTFPWLLEGKDEVYASYWATLLSQIAKEQVKEKFWQLEKPQAPQSNQPVILAYTDYTLPAAPPTATITNLTDSTSINLPLAQQQYQSEKYNGTFWPAQSGWYKVEVPDVVPYFFYVQEPSYWEFESIAAKQSETQAFIAQQRITPATTAVAYQEEPVSLIWFFVLFVLSSGFLWLEEKL